MAVHPIPRVITLPFGYRISIKQLNKAAFKVKHNAVFGNGDEADTVAFCIPADKGAEIILDQRRKWTDKRDDLFHELSHVMVEYGEYIKTIH